MKIQKRQTVPVIAFVPNPFGILEGPNIILMTAPLSSIAFTFPPFHAEWSWAEGKIESGGLAVALIHLWKHTAPRPLLPYRCSPLEKCRSAFGPSPPRLLASSPPTCTCRTEAQSLTFCTGSRQQSGYQGEINESFAISAVFLTCNIYDCHSATNEGGFQRFLSCEAAFSSSQN